MKEHSRQPVHVDPPTPAPYIKRTWRSDIENNTLGMNSFITFHIEQDYLQIYLLKRGYMTKTLYSCLFCLYYSSAL